MDFSSLTNTDPLNGPIGLLTLETLSNVVESALPIVGVAVLVGFLFYVVRWSIGLFRGI